MHLQPECMLWVFKEFRFFREFCTMNLSILSALQNQWGVSQKSIFMQKNSCSKIYQEKNLFPQKNTKKTVKID